jgi:hypothetical protein
MKERKTASQPLQLRSPCKPQPHRRETTQKPKLQAFSQGPPANQKKEIKIHNNNNNNNNINNSMTYTKMKVFVTELESTINILP